LKNYLSAYLLKLFSRLYSRYSVQYITALRRMPNTFIDETVTFGDFASYNIQNNFKQINILKGVVTRKYCNLLVYQNASLLIGEGVFFNNYCSINCLGFIEIGENTMFGEGVKLYDHNHLYHFENGRLDVRNDKYRIGYIKIGRNCWIGSNVTILKDVEIGDNVIIGANCLIYKSIPTNTIVKAGMNLIIENI